MIKLFFRGDHSPLIWTLPLWNYALLILARFLEIAKSGLFERWSHLNHPVIAQTVRDLGPEEDLTSQVG